jgi:hypothetical protein
LTPKRGSLPKKVFEESSVFLQDVEAVLESCGCDSFSVSEELEAPDASVDLFPEVRYRVSQEEVIGGIVLDSGVVKVRFSKHCFDLSVDVFLGFRPVDGHWPKHEDGESSGLLVNVPGCLSRPEEAHEAFFVDFA